MTTLPSPDPTPNDGIAAWLAAPDATQPPADLERGPVAANRVGPDLAELRWLAEAATPGPWYGVDELSLLIENERATEDIPYIAAANPAVVLALLDVVAERDALAAKVERVRALHWPQPYADADLRAVSPSLPKEVCAHCRSTGDGAVPWPCPTIRALDEEAQP